MKVIRVKKSFLAIASVLLALFVMVGLAAPAVADSHCYPITIVQSGNTICVPLTAIDPAVLEQLPSLGPLPTITVSVTDTITKTVKLPRVTVTKTKALPKSTSTVTVRSTVKQTVRVTEPAKTVRVPGPVTTQSVTLPRQTVTDRVTITEPPVTNTVTATATQTVTAPPKDAVVLTRIKAASISLLLVLIGVIIAIGLVWASFTYGWFKGDSGNREFIKEMAEDLRYDDK